MTEIQNKILGILEWIDDVCKKNDLKYYVIGGTALGVVRHQGFIPWDDDADIGLPREDYEKFVSLRKTLLNEEKYVIETPFSSCEHIYSFCKVYDTSTTLIENTRKKVVKGVYVDVFPIDGVGNSMSESKKNCRRILRFKNFNAIINSQQGGNKYNAKKVAADILYLLANAITTPNKVAKHMDKMCQKKKYSDSSYVANICGAWGIREIMKKEWFGVPVRAKFENICVNIPCEYDKYLSTVYGDYMKLPPKEKQVSHHNFYYLDLNRPCNE